jgi:hypothetical protein
MAGHPGRPAGSTGRRIGATGSVIEILRFRLAGGVDEAAFVAADKRVQAEFAYQQPGLVRRTTARGDDGDWIVVDIWRNESDADAADGRWGTDPSAALFMSLIDPSSVETTRYHELGS